MYCTVTVEITCYYNYENIEYLLIDESSLFVNTFVQRSKASGCVLIYLMMFSLHIFLYDCFILTLLILTPIVWNT